MRPEGRDNSGGSIVVPRVARERRHMVGRAIATYDIIYYYYFAGMRLFVYVASALHSPLAMCMGKFHPRPCNRGWDELISDVTTGDCPHIISFEHMLYVHPVSSAPFIRTSMVLTVHSSSAVQLSARPFVSGVHSNFQKNLKTPKLRNFFRTDSCVHTVE